ncbi:MAG: TIGR01620 family protein [Paracoccus sp. (in: a-proteobacteria)]|nr:TIGR01620 family protein [Paracoccus sp. (in: a-proteobacteria)]
MSERRTGPVLIELEDDTPRSPRAGPAHQVDEGAAHENRAENPADAAPVDAAAADLPRPRTMEMVTRLVGSGPSPLTRFFLNVTLALVTFLASVAALNFINGLMLRWPLLGWIGALLFAGFVLALLLMAIREWRAWARFRRIDGISRTAAAALASGDLDAAKSVTRQLDALYAGRADAEWGRNRLAERAEEAFDAETLLGLAEAQLLAPLDAQARREIEAAARSVAAVTALVPIALADLIAALAANLRMIRRMAEIYGGRAGAVGGWRLARLVVTHLIATGAVAAGDDLVQTVAGGGILARLSRRFGEGIVNGALTARVGIAAMEVCRPLPFIAQPKPRVGNLLSRGLRGLFGSEGDRALDESQSRS